MDLARRIRTRLGGSRGRPGLPQEGRGHTRRREDSEPWAATRLHLHHFPHQSHGSGAEGLSGGGHEETRRTCSPSRSPGEGRCQGGPRLHPLLQVEQDARGQDPPQVPVQARTAWAAAQLVFAQQPVRRTKWKGPRGQVGQDGTEVAAAEIINFDIQPVAKGPKPQHATTATHRIAPPTYNAVPPPDCLVAKGPAPCGKGPSSKTKLFVPVVVETQSPPLPASDLCDLDEDPFGHSTFEVFGSNRPEGPEQGDTSRECLLPVRGLLPDDAPFPSETPPLQAERDEMSTDMSKEALNSSTLVRGLLPDDAPFPSETPLPSARQLPAAMPPSRQSIINDLLEAARSNTD